MMRSVLNEGTGAARAAGFALDAAGKSGTTERPPRRLVRRVTRELLTVVWVGFDDNRPVGLSGTQAALIWTAFMMRALAGRLKPALRAAPRYYHGGHRSRYGTAAQAACPRIFREAFPGTEPSAPCNLHQW